MNAVWYFVFLSVAFVAGKPNKKIWIIPKEIVSGLIKASADCTDKLGLETIDILPKYFSGDLEDSDLIRKYFYCLGTNSGYIDVNGKIKKEKLAKSIGEYKEKVESVSDECNKAKYNDKYETVFRAIQCFRENSGLELRM